MYARKKHWKNIGSGSGEMSDHNKEMTRILTVGQKLHDDMDVLARGWWEVVRQVVMRGEENSCRWEHRDGGTPFGSQATDKSTGDKMQKMKDDINWRGNVGRDEGNK
jgi:hypothetical protein